MTEKKEEDQPDWLADVLVEAKERQEEQPAMVPPPVNTQENLYVNQSDEERRRSERVVDLIIVFVIFILFLGLLYVLLSS